MSCQEVRPPLIQVLKIVIQRSVYIRSWLCPFRRVHFFETHLRKLRSIDLPPKGREDISDRLKRRSLLRQIARGSLHHALIVYRADHIRLGVVAA